MEVCKEGVYPHLAQRGGFQNVTIGVDEDLATHRALKRNIEELEVDQGHGHDHHPASNDELVRAEAQEKCILW